MSQSQQAQNLSNNENKTTESTSQYQIRPSAGKSFPIVGIREIINEVLLQVLDGKFIFHLSN